jgi:V8-like Glu-specific endopeptidase
MRIRRIILPSVMAASMAGVVISAGAASAANPADPSAAVVHQSTQSAQDVQAYWTPDRIREAKPMPEPEASTRATGPAQTHLLPAVSAPGSLPANAQKLGDGVVSPADATQSKVWTKHGQMPATTVGKLRFDTGKGGAECTASVINSANRSMIWTAGHCVSDGNGHWYSNFQFIPDYHDRIEPLGSWVWKSVSTPKAWFNGAKFEYDLAAISLRPQNGAKVADVTGYQGYKFNHGYNWNAYEFGYPYDTHPARHGINGQQLHYCIEKTWQTGNLQAIHCDQGHGASGGPWLDDLQLGRGWGYLIGNVSHHVSESSDEERGPHFGDAAVNVYNAQTNA